MTSLRARWLTRPVFRRARSAMPGMSETERAAIEAGDVWWDRELFSGTPDWRSLLSMPPASLTEEEQAFIDGPVEDVCAMLDDWRVNWELRDLPEPVWAVLRKHGFFGMIIPKEHGGLGFSAFAHSEVVRRLSTRCLTAAVTVMVPNSLGPGELLLMFGTEAQREYWLPRLADGRELPCFGLTSPHAGSDAAAMTDTGVVCTRKVGRREVVGVRLDWDKRYITLAPVATVLGLAFKMRDPDRILGEREDIGITLALVPTDTKGVTIGRRHLPAMQMFQNGPTQGQDVFVPLDAIIGGPERAGQGWAMLMTALSAGRGISLPSLSSAGASFAAHTTGAYARVREQFNLPIGRFEGVQERLARLAANAYMLDAARRLTCAAIDEGHKPAVVSAIMKLQATERLRHSVEDAMDVHAGKAVIDGPGNYMGTFYRAVPIGITVEGANILTRSLIVFGQGAIRSHPHLLDEMKALAEPDREKGLADFDRAFWRHVGHSLGNAARAFTRAWTGGRLAPAPDAGAVTPHYRQLSRYSAAFALVADMALLVMGGALKRREMLSARLGDILSELYLLSAVLKRWEDEGREEADLPVVRYCMAAGIATIESRLAEVFANFPSRFAAGLMRLMVLPRGPRRRGPSDELAVACAELLTAPSAARQRIVGAISPGRGNDGIARVERAFELVVTAQPIRERLRRAGITDVEAGRRDGVITDAEAKWLDAAAEAVAAAVAVDDFAAEDLAPLAGRPAEKSKAGTSGTAKGESSSHAKPRAARPAARKAKPRQPRAAAQ